MITKVLVGAGISVAAAVGIAAPAGADPSVFGVLSCSCQQAAPAPDGEASVTDQVNEGIQRGLADLQGIGGQQ